MTEILVAACGVANGLFFYLIARHGAEERRRMLAAVLAKDPAEFVALDRATAAKPKRRKKSEKVIHPHGL